MAVENHPCVVCGQLDDHPMIHDDVTWTALDGTTHVAPSFHFDCYPPDLAFRLGTPETHPHHANTLAAIEAAKSGTHGDDLRDHIAGLADEHNDNITVED
jgi:phage/plasmid primase-like uncharacterized protein